MRSAGIQYVLLYFVVTNTLTSLWCSGIQFPPTLNEGDGRKTAKWESLGVFGAGRGGTSEAVFRNSAAAFDINYTINRSRWHAGRPSGLGHEWVGFLFITKREPSHAMNEFPTAPPSGGADTLDGGFVFWGTSEAVFSRIEPNASRK